MTGPKNPTQSRHKLAEIMFESMNVPQFYLANQSVLGLFATGKISGLVVDCGAGVSSSVPVY
jgi:actin